MVANDLIGKIPLKLNLIDNNPVVREDYRHCCTQREFHHPSKNEIGTWPLYDAIMQMVGVALCVSRVPGFARHRCAARCCASKDCLLFSPYISGCGIGPVKAPPGCFTFCRKKAQVPICRCRIWEEQTPASRCNGIKFPELILFVQDK